MAPAGLGGGANKGGGESEPPPPWRWLPPLGSRTHPSAAGPARSSHGNRARLRHGGGGEGNGGGGRAAGRDHLGRKPGGPKPRGTPSPERRRAPSLPTPAGGGCRGCPLPGGSLGRVPATREFNIQEIVPNKRGAPPRDSLRPGASRTRRCCARRVRAAGARAARAPQRRWRGSLGLAVSLKLSGTWKVKKRKSL